MKEILRTLVFFVFVNFLHSCDVKSCEDVVCGINQTCRTGTCFCVNGYEGDNCEELSYLKYLGSYNISKSCTEGNGAFTNFGTIQSFGSPVNELQFINFLGLGQTAYAYIATDQSGKGNYIQFQTQNLGSASIVGEGYYEEYNTIGRLRLEIQSTINNQVSVCTYSYY